MKKEALAVLLAFAILSCNKDGDGPGTSPGAGRVSKGAPASLSKPDEVRVRLDLSAARAAVRAHRQIQGMFPKDLSSLGLRLAYPDDLKYDAANGVIQSKTYPAL